MEVHDMEESEERELLGVERVAVLSDSEQSLMSRDHVTKSALSSVKRIHTPSVVKNLARPESLADRESSDVISGPESSRSEEPGVAYLDLSCPITNGDALPQDHHPRKDPQSRSTPSVLFRSGWTLRKDVVTGKLNENPLRESLLDLLSVFYSILLIIFGFCLPITVVFSEQISEHSFEAFYIYLLTTSIVIFAYISYCCCCIEEERSSNKTKSDLSEENRRIESRFQLRRKGVVWYTNVGSTTGFSSSFYLRLGATGFACGTIILLGLEIAEQLESDSLFTYVKVVREILQLIFTLVQLFMIFIDLRIFVQKRRFVARFALMHLIATNLSACLRAVIKETTRATEHHFESTTVSNFTIQNESVHVNRENLTAHSSVGVLAIPNTFTAMLDTAAPILYLFIVDYSFIAAGIMYGIWQNLHLRTFSVGQMSKNTSVSRNPRREESVKNRSPTASRSIIDRFISHTGLLCGLLTLAASLASIVVFCLLRKSPYVSAARESALLLGHGSQIVVNLLGIVAVLLAFHRLRNTHISPRRTHPLQETILSVSTLGVFAFALFNIVAGISRTRRPSEVLTFTSQMSLLTQAFLQSIFVLIGLRRSAKICTGNQIIQGRPGRQLIIFLILCNIAMLFLNVFHLLSFEFNRSSVDFYGLIPWTIVVHATLPFNVLYRFHSTVCLVTILNDAYGPVVTT